MLRRSQLFVPANDERKIRKSVTLGADSIIFDIEDAVPPEQKSNARSTLANLINELECGGKEICVRINKVSDGYSSQDISLVARIDKITSIVIPKAEQIPTDIHKNTGKTLIPLIETARGLLNVEQIARTDGVGGIAYGPADFASSVGGATEAFAQNLFVKTAIVVAAAAYGIDGIDGVFFELSNLEGFRSEALQSRDLGYVGKQVVHPSQIEIANDVYSPSQKQVSDAMRIVELYEDATKKGTGAIRVEESLVDAVHYRQARALLDRAKQISNSSKTQLPQS